MHMGLPLPRVEILDNGTEFYVNKVPEGFLRYLSNDIRSNQFIDTVDPINGLVVNRVHATINERISFINQARSSSFYKASEDSFTRNLEFGDIPSNVEIPVPTLDSAFANAVSKGKEKASEGLEDIELTPKAGPTQLPYDLEDPFYYIHYYSPLI
jgi:hypothetical protein